MVLLKDYQPLGILFVTFPPYVARMVTRMYSLFVLFIETMSKLLRTLVNHLEFDIKKYFFPFRSLSPWYSILILINLRANPWKIKLTFQRKRDVHISLTPSGSFLVFFSSLEILVWQANVLQSWKKKKRKKKKEEKNEREKKKAAMLIVVSFVFLHFSRVSRISYSFI